MVKFSDSKVVLDGSNYTEILRKKNTYVGTVFIAGITFVQLFNGVLGVPVSLIITVLGVLYAIILPIMLLGYFRKTRLSAEVVRYALMLTVIGFWAVSIPQDPFTINIVFMVFFVTLMSIYQEILTNIITLVLSVGLLVYFYTTDMKSTLFGGDTFYDFIYYVIAYFLIATAGFVIGYFNNTLLFSLRKQREEIERSNNQVKALLDNIHSALDNLKKQQESTHEVSAESILQIENSLEKLVGVNRLMEEQLSYSNTLASESANSINQISQLNNNLEDVDKVIDSTREYSQISASRVGSISDDLSEFTQVVEELTKHTSDILKKANMVSGVVSALEGVSKQTEILALNAGIESARAGEHGRGFAVIATEIKKLAGTSKESAVSLRPVLEEMQKTLSYISSLYSKTESGIMASKDGLNEIRNIVSTIAEKNDTSAQKVKEMFELGSSLNETLLLLQSALVQNTAVASETKNELSEVTSSMDYSKKATNSLVQSFHEVGRMLNGVTLGKDAYESAKSSKG